MGFVEYSLAMSSQTDMITIKILYFIFEYSLKFVCVVFVYVMIHQQDVFYRWKTNAAAIKRERGAFLFGVKNTKCFY